MSKAPDRKQFADTGLMSVCFNKINAAYNVAEGDILKDVVIVQVGEAAGHYVNIDQQFIVDTVRMGNAAGKIKCRLGHPKDSWYDDSGGGDALRNFVGAFSNFRVDGNRAIADLKVSSYAKYRDLVFNHAATHPEFFDNRIVFEYLIFCYNLNSF